MILDKEEFMVMREFSLVGFNILGNSVNLLQEWFSGSETENSELLWKTVED